MKNTEPYYRFVTYRNGTSEIRLVNPGDPEPFGWSSMSGGTPRTEAELRESAKIHPEPCTECGQLFGTNYIEPTASRLRETRTCFGCDHFRQLIGRKDGLRINGSHYVACKGNGGGFGGRAFTIRRTDTGETIETSNLWHQGTIPPHFRDRLPDNAEFVQKPQPIGHGQGYLS